MPANGETPKMLYFSALGGLAALVVSIGQAALADTLYLHNGDRLTGQAAGVREGKLVFITEYAGELLIELGEVERLVDDEGQPLPPEPVEPGPPVEEKREKKWSGSVDLGMSFQSGEVDTFDTNLGAAATRQWPEDVLTLDASAAYGEVESEVNTRRIRGAAKLQHYLNERAYLFGQTGAEYDPVRRLDLRLAVSSGAGYDFLKSEKRRLAGELGVGYALERWNRYSIQELEQAKEQAGVQRLAALASLRAFLEGLRARPISDWGLGDLAMGVQRLATPFQIKAEQETRTEHEVELRLAGYYEQRLFEKTTLTEQLTVLPNVDDLSDYRVISDLASTTPLAERLSLRLNLQSNYDSSRGDGDDLLTHIFIAGLRYSF